MFDYLVVGAGFAGAVMAERLASDAGRKVLLVDKRWHVGGNAHDAYDTSGILVHTYGPHIFHTNSRDVFDYLSQFTDWRPYQHRVRAWVDGQLLPLPINLDTVNTSLWPETDVVRARAVLCLGRRAAQPGADVRGRDCRARSGASSTTSSFATTRASSGGWTRRSWMRRSRRAFPFAPIATIGTSPTPIRPCRSTATLGCSSACSRIRTSRSC